MILECPFSMQAEWYFYNAGKTVDGTSHERQKAISILLDMARNHEDDRLRSRAASLVALRGWGNVEVLARPEGAA